MKRNEVVVYYRRREDGRKAYGLDPAEQRKSVATFLDMERKKRRNRQISQEFIELECEDRPVLHQAIEAARGGLLLIACGYRMTVNVRFLLMLRDVRFAVADIPGLTTGSLSTYLDRARSWAGDQSTIIRKRMKGVVCGAARKGHFNRKNEHLRQDAIAKATQASSEARTERMRQAYSGIMPLVARLLKNNETFARIADRLNEDGFLTTAGKPFSASTVHRIYHNLTD